MIQSIYLQIDTEFLEILAFWYWSSHPLLHCFLDNCTYVLSFLAFCLQSNTWVILCQVRFILRLSLATYLLRYSKAGFRDRSSSSKVTSTSYIFWIWKHFCCNFPNSCSWMCAVDAVRGLCLSAYHTKERSLQSYSPHLLNENGKELHWFFQKIYYNFLWRQVRLSLLE